MHGQIEEVEWIIIAELMFLLQSLETSDGTHFQLTKLLLTNRDTNRLTTLNNILKNINPFLTTEYIQNRHIHNRLPFLKISLNLFFTFVYIFS